MLPFFIMSIVFPYRPEAKEYHICSLSFSRAIRMQQSWQQQWWKIPCWPELLVQFYKIALHLMTNISRMSYWRWSPAPGTLKTGVETMNWLEINFLDLKYLPLTMHQEKKQTSSLFLLQPSVLLPKQNHMTKLFNWLPLPWFSWDHC